MPYDDTNKGAIWKNDDRATDTQPHFRGSANIDGVEYWVNAWKRDPGGNPKAPALKMTFRRKDEAARPSPKREPAADMDDDIPF